MLVYVWTQTQAIYKGVPQLEATSTNVKSKYLHQGMNLDL